MRVPVILVVPTHKEFRRSATAMTTNLVEAAIDLQQAPKYGAVELDPTFPAIPIGSGVPGVEMATVLPDVSEKFAIRGYLDVDGQTDIPSAAGTAAVYSDPRIAPMLTCGGSAPLGNAAAVAKKLNVAGLAARGLDGTDVAIAIVDTGINLAFVASKLAATPLFDAAASWSPPGTPPPNPGAWPVAHGSMCAFDALIAAPKATLVDFPVLTANYPGGGSVMSGTLSAAIAAYGYMLTAWASGPLTSYKALIASNSWGLYHPSWDFPAGHPGRYCDNPGHPFNVQLGAASRAGIDIVFAVGNCGAPCADNRCQGRTTGSIMGASAMADVLTVAGCDLNDNRVGYSSQGPSIANMYSQKPDITGYTHFLGSEAFGSGTPDSGTSAACPVLAGCVAALRTSASIPPRTVMSPAALCNALRMSARPKPAAQGWNGDYGFGIVDPSAAATAIGIP